MKLAIITITTSGEELAQNLKHRLEQDHTILKIDLYHKKVKNTLNNIFHKYDCILGIMATGIMVRSISHLIEDKTKDPAILVMDEKGEHVISLLSGHYGGGNSFTLKIADMIGADPVITTATDVNGKLGVDALAFKYYLEMEPVSEVLNINRALVNHEEVKLKVPLGFNYLFKDRMVKSSYHLIKSTDKLEVHFKEDRMVLKPKKVVLGVGSRKGISCDSVLFAVGNACDDLGIPVDRIDLMVTAEPKEGENGIMEAADRLNLQLEVVSLGDLRRFKHPEISKSPWVMKNFKIPGVCEPTALYAAGDHARLVYRKKAFDGVTVAIAVAT